MADLATILKQFEQQAEDWMALGDEAEDAYRDWAMKRSMVHSQILDMIASGANGDAKVNALIRANRAFTEDTVKLCRAWVRQSDAKDKSGNEPKVKRAR